MPFSYDQLEDEVAGYLLPLIPTADIEVMPEKESEYKRSVTRPRITIMYGGSDFELPQSTAKNSQVELINIVASIRCKYRRGENGTHHFSGLLKKYLLGWKGSNTDKFFLRSIDFEERNESINEWLYTVTFQAKKLQVETLIETEFEGSTLREVIFNDKVQIEEHGSNN